MRKELEAVYREVERACKGEFFRQAVWIVRAADMRGDIHNDVYVHLLDRIFGAQVEAGVFSSGEALVFGFHKSRRYQRIKGARDEKC